MRGLVQVAGVMDVVEARMLRGCGVDWLGFPFCLPVHREDLTLAEAAELIRTLSVERSSVLITYLDRAHEIASLCHSLNVTRVQLHGDISIGELRRLRRDHAEFIIAKSLVVTGDNTADLRDRVTATADFVDLYITDTHDPATGADGATGKTHDWDVSRDLARGSSRPLILAGGLDGMNVAEGIRHVGPLGVDAHTRLEQADGRKDPAKVRLFVEQARRAFAEFSSPWPQWWLGDGERTVDPC